MNNLKNWLKIEASSRSGSQTENTAARASSKNDCNADIEATPTPPSKKPKLNPPEENLLRDNDELPHFLTEEKQKRLKENNNWLIVKKDGLGCMVCQKVQDLGVLSDKNLRLSKVWQKCSVVPNGKTAESIQSSLRKKIYEHKNSDAHKKASEILEKSTKKEINSNIDNMHKVQFSTTEKIFRTVYKIVKHQRPFVDLPVDVDLQILNGISMGNILHSDKTCSEIAIHISSEMKKKIAKKF